MPVLRRFLLIACGALAVPALALAAPMAGVQTIGPSGTYASFSAAASAVLANGVSSSLTFEIAPGTYDEPLVLDSAIPGASDVNRVQFISATGNPADVTLRQPAMLADGSDAVVRIAGASFVTVGGVTIAPSGGPAAAGAALVVLSGDATDDQLLDCVLSDTDTSRIGVAALAGAVVERLELRRNRFDGLRTGVSLVDVASEGVVVDANTLAGGAGLIVRNTTATSTRITNNFISVLSGSAPALQLDDNAGMVVAANSVNVVGTGSALTANLAVGSLTLTSNVLACPGGGPAYVIGLYGGSITSDWNDIYSTGVTLASWTAPAADLAALRTLSGQEAHSVSGSPGFASATDLHTHLAMLDGAGTPVSGVTTDVDGEARNASTPDIGADEFTAVAALSGTYTIGATGTYPTFAAAVTALMNRGVSAAVTFNVQTGTYVQPLVVPGGVAGAGAAKRIRFVALTGNAADVTLQQPAVQAGGSDAIVRFDGARYVSVEKMTLTATGGAATQAALVRLTGGATDDRVLDCVLNDPDQTRNSVTAPSGAAVDRLELRRNKLNGFRYGVSLTGVRVAGLVVDANTMIGAGGGVFLQSGTGAGALLTNNFVIVSGGTPGFELDHDQDVAALHNSIHVPSVGQALVAQLSTGTLTLRNNVFACLGGGTAYTIYLYGGAISSDYNDLYTTGTGLASWNGAAAAGDLATLRTQSGQEAHSVSVNPGFVSTTDLHTHLTGLNAAGGTGTGVTTDIDGEARGATPDIGADEFTPLTPLAGTYTVGATGTYPTLAAATAALLSRGISAAVTFDIQTGTYTEPVALPGSIAGATAANRVRFVSHTGNAADVTLRQPALQQDGSDAVVRLIGTRYVSIEQVTLLATGGWTWQAPIVLLTGNATDVRLTGCVIRDPDQSRRAIASTNGTALDRLELRRDRFDGFGTGISLATVSATGLVIDGNTMTGTGAGMSLQSMTGTGARVSNNMIVGGNFGVTLENNADLRVVHNTIRTAAGGTALQSAMVAGALTVQNNVLACPDGGIASAIYLWGGTAVSDYNDVYTTGATLAVWNSPAADLAALRTLSGQDAHTVSGNPGFVSATDLHTHLAMLDGAATPLADVTTDIDGEARNATTPDIGADEFAPVAALSGTYVVGATGVYTTLSAAIGAAMSRGIAGPVTFAIQPGTYTQSIAIPGGIAGAGPSSRVTFVSQTGNAADVILKRPVAQYGVDGVVMLIGTRFVTVDRLTLTTTGGDGYGVPIVYLDGGTTDDQILGCVISDPTQTRISVSAGPTADRVEIRRNRIDGFSTAISFAGGRTMAGLVIEANTMIGSGAGMLVQGGTGAGALIANNFVVITGGSVGLEFDNNADLTFAFNSVHVMGAAVALTGQLSYGSLRLLNNILAANGGTPVITLGIYGGTIVIDYNDYLAWGDAIAIWNNQYATTLAALQGLTGQDTHSLFTPPGFLTSTDLHTFVDRLDGAALPIAGVTTDVDGQPRDPLHPDIGADEYVRPNTAVGDVPLRWQLAAPTPNPSRVAFRIGFDLPTAERVRVALFDVSGRRVLEPEAGHVYEPGRHSLTVRTDVLAPGLYFCRVHAGPYDEVRRVVVGR